MSNIALQMSAIGLEQFKSQHWNVTLPSNIRYEQLFDQDVWKHVASRIKQGDVISVRNEEHTLYAQLYVRASDRTWVQAVELTCKVFDSEVTTEAGGYEIRWGGPKTRFGVYRTSDKERIKDSFQTKEIASGWLEDHLRKTAA